MKAFRVVYDYSFLYHEGGDMIIHARSAREAEEIFWKQTDSADRRAGIYVESVTCT